MNTKRGLKYFIITVSAALILVAILFLGWRIMPASKLYIAVLDKTVPATAADGHSYLDDVDNIYRKHLGFNWLLNYHKIHNPVNGQKYSETKDYYGYLLNNAYEIQPDERLLEDMEEFPDLLYLSDTYGTEITEDKGISAAEMNMISMCSYAGATVIGEQDIMTTTSTDEKVSEQLQELFGIHQTGWVGRYIYDLADLTDVPYWAPPMYKEKYGVEWRCSGSGILLVSSDGDILVFEARKDFEDDSLLRIRVAEDYRKEFGKRKVNYYTWFELIEPVGSTETLAEYEFNFNSTGMEKFAPVSDSPIFTAVTRTRRTENSAPAYYFAGDFGDYVNDRTVTNFLGANIFYRAVSVDRDGDVTHFFWHFYEPFMTRIIKQVKNDRLVTHATEEDADKPDAEVSKISGGSLAAMTDNGWEAYRIKGFNVRAEAPGDNENSFSGDYRYYQDLISAVGDMGGNTVRAYDLYPPEFYRAVYEHNADDPENRIRLIQDVTLPGGVDTDGLFTEEGKEAIRAEIAQTVDAIHGKIKLTNGEKSLRYINNMADVTVCYIVSPDLTEDRLRLLAADRNASYEGKYLSASGNGAEALLAMMGDMLLTYHTETYGVTPTVFLKGDAGMLTGTTWVQNNAPSFNPSAVTVAETAAGKVGAAFSAKYSDAPYLAIRAVNPDMNANVYGQYLDAIKAHSSLPTLIDALGASTCVNVFNRSSEVYGLSEETQASQIVSMLRTVDERDFTGALIADLNDTWASVGQEARAYTVPPSSTGLWHDVTDPAQTAGVLSVDPAMPTDIGLDLAQNNERMTDMQLMRNETYLYVTVSLDTDVDYTKEQLIIGFDTYQRNNGEYYYDTKFFGNALSGMEFIIKFESKNNASLYCVPSYNRNKAQLSSAESYTASYELVMPLKYGSFSTQNTQFFQTGNTVHIRLPWAALNISDPSQRIVLNDTTPTLTGPDDTYETTLTTGLVASVFIGDIETKDTNYVFPADKQSPGYRRYEWAEWKKENVTYTITEKAAAESIKKYFSAS